jgi:Transposase DDE domain
VVYGDSAYGTGAHLAWLGQQGFTPMVKTQLPTAPSGRFAKDQFRLDLQAGTVTCPARVTVAIRPAPRGGGRARFGVACSVCPLRQGCTRSARGRVVAVHPREAELAAARARQRDPAWLADYRATRPKVEELQVLLACWAGACPVCNRPAPGWLRHRGQARAPT